MGNISSKAEPLNLCTHCEVQFKEILDLLESPEQCDTEGR